MESILKEPFYDCPRYKSCSVNNCPLCTAYPDMPIDEGDIEQKCTIAKTIRARIAAEYPGMLKYEGLTPREYQGRERWNNLSPEEQEAIRDRSRNTPLIQRRAEGI